MEYNFWDDRTYYNIECPFTNDLCYNVDENDNTKCNECETYKEFCKFYNIE